MRVMFLYYFLQFWYLLKWTDTELKYMHNTICGWQNIICCKNIEAFIIIFFKKVWNEGLSFYCTNFRSFNSTNFYKLRFCVLIGIQASIKVYIWDKAGW